MGKKSNKIVGTTTKFAEMVVQVIALGTFFCTLILVIDRAAVCSFYNIPATYVSLDPVSAIPVIGVFYPIIIILGILGSRLYECILIIKEAIPLLLNAIKEYIEKRKEKKNSETIRDDKEINKKEADESTSKPNIGENNIESEHEINDVQLAHDNESPYSKVDDDASNKGINKKDIVDTWVRTIKDWLEIIHYDIDNVNSKIALEEFIKHSIVIILGLKILIIIIKAENSIAIFGTRFFSDVISVFCFIAAAFAVFFGKIFFRSIKREHKYSLKKHHHNNNNKHNNKSSKSTRTYPSFFKIKLGFFFLTTLVVFSSTITLYETIHLTLKSSYGIVEINDNGTINQYAIVLDLDDRCVLERIVKDNDNEIMIDTSTYIYKEKDTIKVKQKSYQKVYINESITLSDIIEALKLLRNTHFETESPEQEQQIHELIDDYIELLEEFKES